MLTWITFVMPKSLKPKKSGPEAWVLAPVLPRLEISLKTFFHAPIQCLIYNLIHNKKKKKNIYIYIYNNIYLYIIINFNKKNFFSYNLIIYIY